VLVVVAGTAEVAIPTLKWLSKTDHKILRIITTPDSKSGRGKILTPSPVARWAESNGFPLSKPNSNEEMRNAFLGADIVLAIAYGRILKKEFLDIPTHGFLNLHFSLLPAYRGAAPVQRAICAGESTTGVTIFRIDENLDTGPIYAQQKYEIPAMATSDEVLKELSVIGALVFEEVFEMINKSIAPKPQSEFGISLAPKISKNEAKINWSLDTFEILNSIRAYTSSPGAWTLFRGNPMKVTSAAVSVLSEEISPGELRVIDRRLIVGTGQSAIEILKIIPSGRHELNVSEWINGARLNFGETFE